MRYGLQVREASDRAAAAESRTLPGISPAVVLAAIVLFGLVLRLACWTGLIGSDDLRYAHYANALAEGRYTDTLAEARRTESVHHGLRYGVILPVAGIYRLGGISERSTIILPLLASTLSLPLMAAVARRLFDTRVAIIAVLLYATFPMQLRLATTLLPEPVAECFILMALLCYIHARERGAALWFAAGALSGIAYLSKEPALFAGVALGVHALWERRWHGAIVFALGVGAVVAAEHAYYIFWQGDLLLRPHATQLHRLDDSPPPVLGSLLYGLRQNDYPQTMLVPGLAFGLHSLLCVIGAAAALALKPRRPVILLLLVSAVPLLYLNLGSWSLQQYVALPKEPRYLMLVYPPLMILTAAALSRALDIRPMLLKPLAVLLAIVMCVGAASGLATRGRIARAEEMAVLREIVRAARTQPDQLIYSADGRWQRALLVFDPSLVSSSPDIATIVLERGSLGLPVIQPGPAARHAGQANDEAQ